MTETEKGIGLTTGTFERNSRFTNGVTDNT